MLNDEKLMQFHEVLLNWKSALTNNSEDKEE